MFTKKIWLFSFVIVLLAVGVLFGHIYLNNLRYPKFKPTLISKTSIKKSNNASPGYSPMWALENIQDMVDEEKNRVVVQIQNTNLLDYLDGVSIGIAYHKANDIDGVRGTYADDQTINAITSDFYKFYDLRPNNIKENLNPRLLLRNIDKQYFIEVTPQQQREMLQKVLDFNIFSMENPIDNIRFIYKRDEKNKLYEPGFVSSDWITFQVGDAVYFDNTLKNKATIDAYIKWLEDNYLTELLKHPVDKWPWRW